jgi:hypothetical protein
VQARACTPLGVICEPSSGWVGVLRLCLFAPLR